MPDPLLVGCSILAVDDGCALHVQTSEETPRAWRRQYADAQAAVADGNRLHLTPAAALPLSRQPDHELLFLGYARVYEAVLGREGFMPVAAVLPDEYRIVMISASDLEVAFGRETIDLIRADDGLPPPFEMLDALDHAS